MKSFIAIISIALIVAAVNGSAYAPSGLKGPPCPKSVVVSCAPLVQSVPCKGGSSSHQGAYSEQYPQYLAPGAAIDEPREELVSASSEYAPRYVVPRPSPYLRYY